MQKNIMLRIVSLLLVFIFVLMPGEMLHAQGGTKLIMTDNAHEFELGSEDKGGTGVEGTSNWIKIIQNSNKMKLFEDIGKGVDVAALQVTFEISNWSGVEFPITWGSNLNFIGDNGSTWCGTGTFEGISNYVINREGEYVVTCDLAALAKAQGKEGIAWLQTCEMVIGNLTEGDKTIINVKEANIYLPGEVVPADNAPKSNEEKIDTITIDPMNIGRTNDGIFEGWGTSLCWYGNRIGDSEKASTEAAELLYSRENGLGLNIIRYNVGGGDDPTHNHIKRSDSNMPGYWTNYNAETDAFEYDFTKDANQQNVLFKSIEQCPEMMVEMFSNSAPYFMTRSGCTSGTTDSIKSNITIENMPAFAEYMATVVKYFVDKGVNVVSVEPMNEPSNGWNVSHYGVKQEGCSVEIGDEQSAMIVAMNAAMEKLGLSDINLAGCDETNDTMTNMGIKKMSEDALELLEQLNTHTYSRNNSSSQKLNKTALDLDKKLWMTETDNGGVQGENAGEMGAALNFASQITADLNNLQPSAWIMWQAIGSYCDESNEFDPDTLEQQVLDSNGFWGVCYADMNEETIVKTKKYYAFGQYTKFIRPGDNLIATEDGYTTAAYNDEERQIKIVSFNTSAEDREVCFDLTAFETSGECVKVIRTSGDYETGENWAQLADLEVVDGKVRATIKGNSVTSFVVNGANHDMEAVLTQLESIEEEPETDVEEAAYVELVDGRPIPVVESVTGRICFASSDWSYTVMADDATAVTGIPVSTMRNGAYSIILPAPGVEGGNATQVIGTVVFCIDLVEYAKQLTGINVNTLKTDEEIAAYHTKIAETVRANITSITQDGEALDANWAKIVVGDTEGNGNLRLEIYNMYGPTAENAAIEPDEIDFMESLIINFNIELAAMSETDKVDLPVEQESTVAVKDESIDSMSDRLGAEVASETEDVDIVNSSVETKIGGNSIFITVVIFVVILIVWFLRRKNK